MPGIIIAALVAGVGILVVEGSGIGPEIRREMREHRLAQQEPVDENGCHFHRWPDGVTTYVCP